MVPFRSAIIYIYLKINNKTFYKKKWKRNATLLCYILTYMISSPLIRAHHELHIYTPFKIIYKLFVSVRVSKG